MVNIFSTAFICDNTSCILHEYHVVTLDGHSYWTFLDGSCQLLWIHLWYINKVGDSDSRLGPVGPAAFSCKTLVWVICLHHDAMVLSVAKRTVHSSTKTSLITIDLCAVNKLLLAEINCLTRFKPVSGFNETC